MVYKPLKITKFLNRAQTSCNQTRFKIYVPRNLTIYAISKLRCTYSEIADVRNLKITWFACAIYIYKLSCCDTWQWVIYCHDGVARRMEDILDKCCLPPQVAYQDLEEWVMLCIDEPQKPVFWDVLRRAIQSSFCGSTWCLTAIQL